MRYDGSVKTVFARSSMSETGAMSGIDDIAIATGLSPGIASECESGRWFTIAEGLTTVRGV